MATTRKYLNHLLQNTGITPACSEEERAAADDIARIFSNHGFEPEVQEFSASATPKLAMAALGVTLFLGAVLMGIGGVVGVIGLLLSVASGVVYMLERMGKISFGSMGSAGLSQNVIAYHKASGPLASPRNRPVVVVAHYDSPRADLFAQYPYATYKPVITKFVPFLMIVPAVIAIVRLLPLPAGAKVVLWLIAIVAALAPLANAVGIIANRFVLPYTSGSVCNKSSVAAMLGVMDAVAPFQHGEEFPNDVPFEDYFSEQLRMRDAAEVEAAVASGDLPEEALEGLSPESTEGEGPVDDIDAGLAGTAALSLDGLAAGTEPAADVASAADATVSMEPLEVVDGTATMPPVSDAPTPAAEGQPADATMSLAMNEDQEQHDVEEEAPSAEEGVAPVDVAEAELVDEEPCAVNAFGNYRYGEDVIRLIGMVPDQCVLEYDLSEPEDSERGEESAAVDEEALAAASPVGDDGVPVPGDMADADAPWDEDEPYDDEGDFAYDESSYGDDAYEDGFREEPDGGNLMSRVNGIRSAAQTAGIAETISSVSSSAARFFDGALRKGKSMLNSMATHIQENEEDQPANDNSAAVADGRDELPDAAPVPVPELEAADAVDAVVEDAAMVPTMSSHSVQADADTDRGAEAPAADATQAFASTPAPNQSRATVSQQDLGATIAQTSSFTPYIPSAAEVADSAVQAAGAAHATTEPAAETVDALMAEIMAPHQSAPAPHPVVQNPTLIGIPDPSQPSISQMSAVNRSSLFDLPDPSTAPVDPFAAEPAVGPSFPAPSVSAVESESISAPDSSPRRAFSVISADQGVVEDAVPYSDGVFETITADAPASYAPAAPVKDEGRRGLGKLFGRKKRQESSMSDWLGVDDDFDAKQSGRTIGSWDNFEDGDWKGGAASATGVSEDDMREAVASMGDDELLGHDIWFVATGASELGGAGMQAFLDTHRDKLRGVFLINLESVGAGDPCMLASEGGEGGKRVLKGDKRIMNLVARVSRTFHREFATVEMPYLATDAYRAMNMSLRSLTIAGIDGNRLACSHTEDDLPYRVEEKNVRLVADVVTEVIRRS